MTKIRNIAAVIVVYTLLGLPSLHAAQSGDTLHDAAARGDVVQVLALLKTDPGLIKTRISYGQTQITFAQTALHMAKTAAVAEALLAAGAERESKNAGGYTPLHSAAWAGNIEVVNCLLTKGANPNCTNGMQQTPLHSAAVMGHAEVVSALLAAKANPNVLDLETYTPLHKATQGNGFPDVAKRLLEGGADANIRTVKGQTALDLALVAKKPAVALAIIAAAPNLNLNTRDFSTGNTALLSAITLGQFDVAGKLLEAGADPALADYHGETALHLAAQQGNAALVALLMTKGADANALDYMGTPPLLLVKNPQVIDILLEKGANPKKGDYTGRTLLHTAARSNKPLVISLLAHGADINAADCMGATPLSFAMMNNNWEIAAFLIAQGARTDIRIPDRVSPFQVALSGGEAAKPVARALMDKLPDLRQPVDRTFGISVLQVIAGYGYQDLAEAALARNADINATDIFNQTPLMEAIRANKTEFAKFLISKGADARCTDRNGLTVLHIAVSAGNIELVKILLDKGIDVNAKNTAGETPLRSAMKNGKTAIADLLRQKGGTE